MSADRDPVHGWLSFWRIVDIPFDTCVATLERWRRAGDDGDLHIGDSILCGPLERDCDTGTWRIQIRLARGPLRRRLPMRLEVDRWSASATALELTPCRRVEPTAAYFGAGHRLIDSLAHSWSLAARQPALAQTSDPGSQPVPAGPGRSWPPDPVPGPATASP